MTVLRAEPFSYRKGMLIRVIARAYNLFEWGQWSQPNVEGALLETEPVGVTTLTFLDTPVSNNNQVLLQWTRLTSLSDIGGIEILDYRVYWKTTA
jgi:hypothetical protein